MNESHTTAMQQRAAHHGHALFFCRPTEPSPASRPTESPATMTAYLIVAPPWLLELRPEDIGYWRAPVTPEGLGDWSPMVTLH